MKTPFAPEDIDNAPESCGVYAIYFTHAPNKAYIGSTSDFRRRWKQHLSKLKAGKHKNFNLTRLFKHYTIRFIILEFTPDAASSREREQELIDYTPKKNLYNLDFEVKKHRSD